MRLAKVQGSVLESPKLKRKIKWKKLVWDTLICVARFGILTLAFVLFYNQGRIDERNIWAPKWDQDRTEYRLMPYYEDQKN